MCLDRTISPAPTVLPPLIKFSKKFLVVVFPFCPLCSLSTLSTPRNRRPRRRPCGLRLHGDARLGLQHAPPRLPGQRRGGLVRADQLREELFLGENALRGGRSPLVLTREKRPNLRSDLGTLKNRGEVGDGLEFLRGNGEGAVRCPRADRR